MMAQPSSLSRLACVLGATRIAQSASLAAATALSCGLRHVARGFCSAAPGSSTEQLQITVEPLSEQHEGVSVLSLNRPNARNAIGRQLLRELQEAIDILRQERSTRCVIVRSLVNGVFCAGADLKERAKMTQQEAAEFVSQIRRTFSELHNLPMPTIAAVDGLALGGGAELALACDLRVVSSQALIAFPETQLGIIPGAGGTQRLPRIVGASRAKQLIFTGQRVSGREALELGLADDLVEVEEPAGDEAGGNGGGNAAAPDSIAAYTRALELAAAIRKAAPLALQQAKAAINLGLDTDLSSGLRSEELAYSRLLTTKDRLEGLAAFAEKRPPRYTGE